MLKIKSELAEVSFSNQAAEITSFKKLSEDIEYMWQGNPKYWAGRNPILFPMVGNTYNKSYEIEDKTYSMGNHGLTRHMIFETIKEKDKEIELETKSNENTLLQYPFPFKVNVIYRLEGLKLSINYKITNTGDKPMPFTFGLHPAFNVPIKTGEFADYKLVFEKEERAIQLLNDDREKECEAFKEIKLNYETFEVFPTLVYRNLNSSYVQLKNENEGIEVGIAGYPYLAFWCGNKAPFLCIEPWYGLGDTKPNDLKFHERPGMMELEPLGEFSTSYYIKLP